MSLHIYTAPGQPMTRYDAMLGIEDEPMWIVHKPREQFRCGTCGHVRWAKNLRIKVYYDGSNVFCAEGHEHPGGDRRRKIVPRRTVHPKNNASPKGD